MNYKPFTLDRTVRLCITIAVIVLLFFITRQLSGVLLPFVVAWFMAYLIHPIVNFFQYKCKFKNRTLSVAVSLVLLMVVIVGLVMLLAAPIAGEVSRFSDFVSAYLSGVDVATFIPEAWQEAIRQWLSGIDYAKYLTIDNLSAAVEKISPYVGGILGGSVSMVNGLFVIFIVVLYIIFILIDYEQISAGMIEIVPLRFRGVVSEIIGDLEESMNKYFRGQALIALSVGVLFSIGFLIMGLPLAIVVGLFIGLLNMVPYLQTAGIPVCMLLGMLQSAYTGTSYWIVLLEIAAVFLVVQSIQDMVLTPLIMGKTIGMKPAVMLLALSIWGSLFGVAGMIIALPLTTVIMSYYKRFVLGEQSASTNTVESAVAAEVVEEAQEVPES